MLAFGELYLNGGRVERQADRVGDVDQGVSQAAHAIAPERPRIRLRLVDRFTGRPYRPITPGATEDSSFSTVPALKLVVATTSLPSTGEGRREHQRAIYDLMEQDLVPAVEMKRMAIMVPRSKL